MSSFVERIVGASLLKAEIYEEVEADSGALVQAMGIVVVAAVAAGIGGAGQLGSLGPIYGSVGFLIGWFIWAGLAYFFGMRLLPEPTTEGDFGEILRTTGFAAAPGILRVLGIVPGIGGFLVVVATLWMMAAMIVAVRQALDYSETWRAVGVCLLGFLIYLGFLFIVGVVGATLTLASHAAGAAAGAP